MTVFSASAIRAQSTPHHTRAAKNAILSSRVITAVNSSSRTKIAQSCKPLGRLLSQPLATTYAVNLSRILPMIGDRPAGEITPLPT